MSKLSDEWLADFERLAADVFRNGSECDSTAEKLAWDCDAVLAELRSLRALAAAAFALRDVTLRAKRALTPAECNRQIVDNANAFREFFDVIDRTRSELSADSQTAARGEK